MEEYFAVTKIENDSDEFIFRGVKVDKKGKQSLRTDETPISYTTVREDVLYVLKSIGLDEKNYGLHCLRSGGASAAANLGVNDRLIQKHGRWKSVLVKNKYISENLNSLLFVSQNLGL